MILSLGALGIEPIRMTRDGAQQLQSLDCSTRAAGKGLDDVVGQPLRLSSRPSVSLAGIGPHPLRPMPLAV